MSRRHIAAAASGVLCLLTLTACGSGLHAQTYKAHSYDYVNVDHGDVAIRNLALDGPQGGTGVIPAGGTARATGTLVAQTDVEDSLTGVTSPDADSVTLEQGGSPATSVTVPKLGRAGDWAVVLTGTHRALRGGTFVELTLTFAKAGRTTLRVPVRSTGFYSGSGEQSATPEPSAS